MKFNRTIEVFNALPTSATSGGLWTQSMSAFLPSGPKKTLFKRESPLTHHLVSNTFSTLTEIPEIGKKPVWGQLYIKYHGFSSLKKSIPSLLLNIVIMEEHIYLSKELFLLYNIKYLDE